MPEASVLHGVQANRLLSRLRAKAFPTQKAQPRGENGGEHMNREPMVFGDMPFSVQVCMIAGAIFLAPYLIVRAMLEERGST